MKAENKPYDWASETPTRQEASRHAKSPSSFKCNGCKVVSFIGAAMIAICLLAAPVMPNLLGPTALSLVAYLAFVALPTEKEQKDALNSQFKAKAENKMMKMLFIVAIWISSIALPGGYETDSAVEQIAPCIDETALNLKSHGALRGEEGRYRSLMWLNALMLQELLRANPEHWKEMRAAGNQYSHTYTNRPYGEAWRMLQGF